MSRLRFLNLGIAAVIVVFLIVRSHPGRTWDALGGTDFTLVFLAVALNLPVALLASLRSFLVFRGLGRAVRADVLLPTTVLGVVAGGLTPAATGEVLRAGALRSRAGVAFEETMLVVAYERVLSVYVLVLGSVLLLGLRALTLGLALPLAAACLLLVFAPWVAARALGGLLTAERPAATGGNALSRASGFMLGLAGQLRLLFGNVGLLLQCSLLSAAVFSVVALQYWVLASGVAPGINLQEAWLALGVSALVGIASLVPLGLGVLDGSLAAMLDRFGMTLGQGTVVALLVRAAVTLPLVLMAFACYVYLQRLEERAQPERPASKPAES